MAYAASYLIFYLSYDNLHSDRKDQIIMRVTCRSRIHKLRTQNKLTQKNLAVLLEVSPRTYSDYETGRLRIPLESLIKLARYYDVDLNYICGISNIRKEYPSA